MSIYSDVLKRMADDFTQESVPAYLRTREDEKELPMDILTVLLEDFSEKGNEWLAEFCFLPLQNGADNTAYLSAAITITDEMTPDEADRVEFFITRFNFSSPYGAFGISDDDSTLTYRLCTPTIDNGSEDTLYEAFNLIAGHALEFVDNFGTILEAIIDGEIAPEEALMQLFGQKDE